jgi:hypothetical protein
MRRSPSRRNTVGARPIRERSSSHAKPNLDGGDAFAAAIPAVGSTGAAPALIAAQQVLSHLLEQFGEWQPTVGYRVRPPLVAPDLTQGLRMANFYVAMALAATRSAVAVDTKCNLAAGAVRIDSRPDGPNNDLILRCRHDPASPPTPPGPATPGWPARPCRNRTPDSTRMPQHSDPIGAGRRQRSSSVGPIRSAARACRAGPTSAAERER